MKKALLLFILMTLSSITMNAQTEEELKAAKAAKEDSISAIQGRADAIQKQIDFWFIAFLTIQQVPLLLKTHWLIHKTNRIIRNYVHGSRNIFLKPFREILILANTMKM